MTPNGRMSLSPAGRLLDRARRGGKKTVAAGVLMSIMLLMWVRVFLGHRPEAAAAAPAAPSQAALRPAPVKVTLVELPKVPGRHESIARDFFAAPARSDPSTNTGTEKEVHVISSNDAQEVIRRVGQTMKLEAVLTRSESPHAYINDRLVGVGDKLTVKDGATLLEFEVLQIQMDSVLVRCEDMQLTLKLAQNLEVVP